MPVSEEAADDWQHWQHEFQMNMPIFGQNERLSEWSWKSAGNVGNGVQIVCETGSASGSLESGTDTEQKRWHWGSFHISSGNLMKNQLCILLARNQRWVKIGIVKGKLYKAGRVLMIVVVKRSSFFPVGGRE